MSLGGGITCKGLLALVAFLCFSALADPIRHELNTKKPFELVAKTFAIEKNDVIVLDGKDYLVEERLGSGTYGVVFKVKVDGRTEALKLLLEPDMIDKPTAGNAFPTQAKALREWKGKVSVPEVYEAPPHGLFMRTEYIDGTTLVDRLSKNPDTKQRIEEYRKVDALFSEIEKSGIHPHEVNIKNNIVYSESKKKYFLVDPDAVTTGGEFNPFRGIEGTPESHFVRFARKITEGEIPSAARALAGKGDAFLSSGFVNPAWLVEYLATTTDHSTYRGMNQMTDWNALSEAQKTSVRNRLMEVARDEMGALRSRPQVTGQGWILSHIVTNPLFQDAEMAEAFLQRIPVSAIDEVWKDIPKAVRLQLDRQPWLMNLKILRDFSAYPRWVQESFEDKFGLSHLSAEMMVKEIVEPRFDRSPKILLEALTKNNFALLEKLDDSHLEALRLLINERVNMLANSKRLDLFQIIYEAEDKAGERGAKWFHELGLDRRSFLYLTARDPHNPLADRVRAVKLSRYLSETDLTHILQYEPVPTELRIAVLKALAKIPEAPGEKSLEIVNEALRSPDLSVQRAARDARNHLQASHPVSAPHFKRDSWKLWASEVCRRVTNQ